MIDKKAILYSPIADSEDFFRIGFYKRDIQALEHAGFDVLPVNKLKDLFKSKPQLVICYFYSWSFFAAVLSRLRGGRVVFTGGVDALQKLSNSFAKVFLHRFMVFFCCLVGSRILVPSRSDYNEVIKLLPIENLRKRVVQGPHYVEPLSGLTFQEFRFQDDLKFFTFCWMGPLNWRRKGLDLCLQVILAVREAGFDATLDVFGIAGSGAEEFEALVDQLSLKNYVKFRGYLPEAEIMNYVDQRSVYLQLSRYEGFGMAAVEALLTGLPVIHSGVGGLSENIGDLGIRLDLKLFESETHKTLLAAEVIKNLKNYHSTKEAIMGLSEKYGISQRSDALTRFAH